jgi:D-beta-D-heptose 7-phosphate kinase/D-beta-D-heptose 1-phosphate adenosyltransferase
MELSMKVDIPGFSQSKVLVVGDIMLDRYFQGPTHRISPEAPVPVVKINQQDDRPGGAANVALNIASLGGQASLIGITGEDEAHQALSTQLSALNVNCQFVQQPTLPTIMKLRVLSRHQQLIRLDFEDSFAELEKTHLNQLTETLVHEHDLLLISDYAKGTLSDVESLISIAKKANIPVIVDPKGSDFSRYHGATLLTPNMSEFEQVVGECRTEVELVEKGQALLETLDLQALIITRSEHGMTLLRRGCDEFHLPTQAREVFDVTGAGDTVIATLGLALAAKAEYTQATALANIAAGIVVGKIGTSTISEAELVHELHNAQESGLGVVSEGQLKILIDLAKARGEKIVMTNGCFDILHAGHVSYLENAKKIGTRLIVAVNDDHSITRLKGAGRPINPLDRRMAVLAGLGAVDWVVRFDEDTPQRLIANILPNVLVKGGDYKVEDIAGGAEVIANGGDVQVLNFEDGISTTEIINSIRLES